MTHLCERVASMFPSNASELLNLLLHFFILLVFLGSYWALFPLATAMEGTAGKQHGGMAPYLQKLHLGQAWAELGYGYDIFSTAMVTTQVGNAGYTLATFLVLGWSLRRLVMLVILLQHF